MKQRSPTSEEALLAVDNALTSLSGPSKKPVNRHSFYSNRYPSRRRGIRLPKPRQGKREPAWNLKRFGGLIRC
jgi:hypothetical protein